MDNRRRGRQEAAAGTVREDGEQATAAWPGIEAGIKTEEGFNPAEGDKWKGKTVKLKGVYNRAGWDWTGYPFAVTITAFRGRPLRGKREGGLDDVYDKTLMSPDNHEQWDVIAVVQGPGKINERTSTEIRDGSTTVGGSKARGRWTAPCGDCRPPCRPGRDRAEDWLSAAGGEAADGAAGGLALAGSGGSGVLGWTWRILSTLLLLLVAGLAFVKAWPAVLAATAMATAPAGAGDGWLRPIPRRHYWPATRRGYLGSRSSRWACCNCCCRADRRRPAPRRRVHRRRRLRRRRPPLHARGVLKPASVRAGPRPRHPRRRRRVRRRGASPAARGRHWLF